MANRPATYPIAKPLSSAYVPSRRDRRSLLIFRQRSRQPAMPNPPSLGRRRSDMPLDEAVGYATHIVITCSPPSCAPKRCGRTVIWRTEDLYKKLPNCKTYRDFTERLYCSRCKRRGWLTIEAAGR